MKTVELKPVFVETIPDDMQEGLLYISRKYETAIHLCCCGCGYQTVTPLIPNEWGLTERNEKVTLKPSIGNQKFKCKSHYWITDNKVMWL